MDRLAEAERLFFEALALQEKGDLASARRLYQDALALAPERPSVMNNLATVLVGLKRFPEAAILCEKLLAANPEDEAALVNLGICQMRLGSMEDALRTYESALQLKPDCPEALSNRGGALLELNRPREALESCDRALALRPDYAEALFNRGAVLLSLNRHEESIECYKRLLEIKPDYDYARGWLLRAQMLVCEWAEYGSSVARIVEDLRVGRRADGPFNFLALSNSAADQLNCSRLLVAHEYPATPQPIWRGERYSHDKVRVAYISADLRNHAVAHLLAGLFEAHDRTRFDITAISLGANPDDEMRTRLRGAFNRFVDVGNKTDREVALLIRALEIDIAVDLQGFTTDCRPGILAQRPSPVQVNFLGYPATMGADYVDYIIADDFVIPQPAQCHYSEKVVYLPDCFQPNDSKRRIGEQTPSRGEAGLPEAGFVFCCFNNTYKITPDMFDVWMRILRRVESSVLWLLGENDTVIVNLRREAQKRGADPGRLVFAKRVGVQDYLARYRLADLFLDTLPFNAGTTGSDALWAGVPLVTCAGEAFASRMAGSLLRAVGLSELITDSWPDYEAMAFRLATEDKLLADVKAKLARNRVTCPLFNTDRFRRHIEAAYFAMWERYQRGEAPANFAVRPVA
jgi:predicted O-linked N-acetylglucosamine transferase (SPINDLY family)